MSAVARLLVALLGIGAAAGAVQAQPPPAIAARLPAGGFLVAHASVHGEPDEWFAILRLDATGAHELVRERAAPDEMIWVDARTLMTVTVDGDTGVATLRRYVDGAGQPPVTIAPARWKPPGTGPFESIDPLLWAGDRGEVWLGLCHTSTYEDFMANCRGRSWLRVDGVPTPVDDAGRHARIPGRSWGDVHGDRLPRAVRRPVGYRVKLRKVDVGDGFGGTTAVPGLRCTGPGGLRATWPVDDAWDLRHELRPSAVRWLWSTPPMFLVTGTSVDIPEWTQVRAFRGCTALEDFRWLGAGRWLAMETVDDGSDLVEQWTLYVDAVAIGSFRSGLHSGLSLQVAPPP
jgi:hypothetical protein